jgi:hypothetical protein
MLQGRWRRSHNTRSFQRMLTHSAQSELHRRCEWRHPKSICLWGDLCAETRGRVSQTCNQKGLIIACAFLCAPLPQHHNRPRIVPRADLHAASMQEDKRLQRCTSRAIARARTQRLSLALGRTLDKACLGGCVGLRGKNDPSREGDWGGSPMWRMAQQLTNVKPSQRSCPRDG